MSYAIIIRGPAGVGKSTISKKLAQRLKAHLISFDELMRRHKLDTIKGGGIPTANFIKANKLVLPQAKRRLARGQPVIFDGCFYRKEQLNHLQSQLTHPAFVFTLQAPLRVCMSRNKKERNQQMTDRSIKAVYSLVKKVNAGTHIRASRKPVDRIVKEILGHLPR